MDIVGAVKHARAKHAWVLGFLALVCVYWVAPVALMPMVLVAAKVWMGLLVGWFADKAFFVVADDRRRVALMSACVLGLALGV